jgi:hypothetical protein
MIYACCTNTKRIEALDKSSLNGISYLEVFIPEASTAADQQTALVVHFVKPIGSGPGSLAASIKPSVVMIEGGESITNITVVEAVPAASFASSFTDLSVYVAGLGDIDNDVVMIVDTWGDFSTYSLRFVNQIPTQPGFAAAEVLTGVDQQFAQVSFSFKVNCPPFFDCEPAAPDCPAPATPPPPINYLAKDYGSFRTVMLDRLNQLLPNWGATSEADLGIALAELVSYVGDHLSYYQDAIGTEAYIQTARRRVSLRRHALLVDYRVHDGANARAWIHLHVDGTPGTPVFMEQGQNRFYTTAPGMPSSLRVGDGNEEAALIAGVIAFEPMHSAVLYPEHDHMHFYTWLESDCCLPQGATEATLDGKFANLQIGDVLIFQEMLGPQTGNKADADIRHRCAVRLTNVATLTDTLTGGDITEIQWAAEDALPFAVCISSTYLDSNNVQQTVENVSVVFGNVILADQGLGLTGRSIGTVPEPRLVVPPNTTKDRCAPTAPQTIPSRFYPAVPDSPITQAAPVVLTALPATYAPKAQTQSLASGTAALDNATGFPSLTVSVTPTAAWPGLFGFLLSPNPPDVNSFTLSVLCNPPGGAAGILHWVVVETFNLTVATAQATLSADSQLVKVPNTFVPPSAWSGTFPTVPTMFIGTGPVSLTDSTGAAFLTLAPTDPSKWSNFFSVDVTTTATNFDLSVQYNPKSGPAVVVESFPGLTLGSAATEIDGESALISVGSFAEALDPSQSATGLMTVGPADATPHISLTGVYRGETTTWLPETDLLANGEEDPVFVVEVETTGQANLRFGDGANGKRPDPGTVFTANYRIGNGAGLVGLSGNVGTDSLINLATNNGNIKRCRNPLSATGGTDPETTDQIRRRAPEAFLTQERAVTMADYAAWTESNSQVDQAVSNLRWTGSWYTVFTAVEPAGGGNLSSSLQESIAAGVEPYRLAGQDLLFDSPQYVSLQIALTVCVDPSYFQSDVETALYLVLGSGPTGLFNADNFTFGQTVYLSPVYAAARTVAGVTSVTATTFQIEGMDTGQYLSQGNIPMGSLQVARLANDPSFPGHGQLTLKMLGGK